QVRDEEKPASTSASSSKAYDSADAAEGSWLGLRPKSSNKTDIFDDELRLGEGAGSLRRSAANDDRGSLGTILRSLHSRPAKTSYVLASIFAGVWVVGGIGLGLLYSSDMQAALGPTGLTAPILAVLAAIYMSPVVFFYVLAHMAWRSQEMRMIA